MNVKLDPGAILPTRAHPTDAGLDLYSREEKDIPAGGSASFDTGVHVELPSVCLIAKEIAGMPLWASRTNSPTVGLIKSKSGLMVNHNITSDGTIDFSYRGSIVVKLFNHGQTDYHVKAGDKISQLVIVPVLTPEAYEVDELTETDRGENGFGSTGR